MAASTWLSRLSQAEGDRLPLWNLYAGEAWAQSRKLFNVAQEAGFTPRLLVASAGLGLVDSTTEAPAYSATFTLGHPDSVAKTKEGNRYWWQALAGSRKGPPLTELQPPVLLVLSSAYASAMRPDLDALAATGREALLIGGDAGGKGLPALPADGHLRKALGGTLGSISLRMATQWVSLMRAEQADLAAPSRFEAWTLWSQGARSVEVHNRRRLEDQEVVEFIRFCTTTEPSISTTAALRRLRDAGLACEQGRFRDLFRKVVDDR